MNSVAKPAKRIPALDFMRGAAVILMILYHTVVAFGTYYKFGFFSQLFLYLKDIMPPFISTVFITVCAVSSYLSRSNVKRGIKTIIVAGCITLITCILLPLFGMNGMGICFGILHFLGFAMLVSPPLIKAVKKIPPYIGITVCAFLFLFTMKISEGYLGIDSLFSLRIPDALKEIKFLFPLGIYSKDFYSADYYPVFPWIFIYIIGLWLGRLLFSSKMPQRAYKTILKPFEFTGRYALFIYLGHVPIIYLIGYILSLIIKK